MSSSSSIFLPALVLFALYVLTGGYADRPLFILTQCLAFIGASFIGHVIAAQLGRILRRKSA